MSKIIVEARQHNIMSKMKEWRNITFDGIKSREQIKMRAKASILPLSRSATTRIRQGKMPSTLTHVVKDSNNIYSRRCNKSSDDSGLHGAESLGEYCRRGVGFKVKRVAATMGCMTYDSHP